MERDLTSLVVNGDGGAGDVWISSNTAKRGGVDMAREVSTVVNAANQCAVLGQPQPSDLQSRIARLKSSQRSFLNGLAVNRAKYTTYSRHFTSARVLRAVASRLQPELRAGDTFIDFACGQNSFGGMLTDPGTRGPLATRAFDVLSPAEKTADFERRNWLSPLTRVSCPPESSSSASTRPLATRTRRPSSLSPTPCAHGRGCWS